MSSNKPILLVEDDVVDQMTVKRALKEIHVTNRLILANNGEEALFYLQNDNYEKPTLILLDINMPKMNGIEFLKVVKANEILKTIPGDRSFLIQRGFGSNRFFWPGCRRLYGQTGRLSKSLWMGSGPFTCTGNYARCRNKVEQTGIEMNIKLLYIEDDIIDQQAFERLVRNQNLPYDYNSARVSLKPKLFSNRTPTTSSSRISSWGTAPPSICSSFSMINPSFW